MDIKDKLKNLHSINMLIESLERLLECDREEFKNFPRLLEELGHNEVLQQIAELKQDQKNTMALINSLDNELQRKVLIERYYNGYNWDKVADNLGYSRVYLYKVHKKPLNSYPLWFKRVSLAIKVSSCYNVVNNKENV